MQPAKIGNKSAGSRVYNLPCHEWRVDAAAWIQIRRGAIIENGAARGERHGHQFCIMVGKPAQRENGLPVREPIELERFS